VTDRQDWGRASDRRRPTSNHHRFQIEPCGPFRLDLTAWALRRTARNALYRWDAATYTRVMSLHDAPVALSVMQVAEPDEPRLSVLLAGRQIDTPAGRWRAAP
jgi:hypothetical protein